MGAFKVFEEVKTVTFLTSKSQLSIEIVKIVNIMAAKDLFSLYIAFNKLNVISFLAL